MRKCFALCLAVAFAGLALVASPLSAVAAVSLTPDDVQWQMVGPDMVRFQLHFHNDGSTMSDAISGAMYSQEFGAFLPHYGTVGSFNVPPLMPESFFDVFFDVPLSSLPPSPGGGGGSFLTAGAVVNPCPPLQWVGNVDVTWAQPDPGGPITVHVNKHFGKVGVCPGLAKSCVHLLTGCAGNITWAFRNVCPGWAVSLETEGHAPAPGALLPGFTGWICVSANGAIPIGSQCCFKLDLTCLGVTTTIDVCAIACDCTTPARPDTWGRLKAIYR
jgi:hypothetical protein